MPHRPDIHRWDTTAGWQRRRAHQLRIEPLCRICLEAGRVTPATVADHVVSHKGDYTAFRPDRYGRRSTLVTSQLPT